jgi:hypothetical protein
MTQDLDELHVLRDVGEGLHAQLDEFSVRPSPDGAERLALNLEGCRRTVLRLREALLCQGARDDK